MLNFWTKVVEELDCYRKVFVAVVVAHRRGSPGTTRAQWLCTEAGEVLGTIGGGVMEARLMKEAESTIKSGDHKPALRTIQHKETAGQDRSGLICGGTQSMVTLVLKNDHRPVLHEMEERLRYGRPGALVISPSGIALEEEDLSELSLILKDDEQNWEVRMGLLNRHRVLVVGAGHCGTALARQMAFLNFHVTVVEPREGVPLCPGLPAKAIKRVKPFAEAGSDLEYPWLTFAVVMTPSYADDVDALAGLLRESFPFIGIMGSPAKVKKINNALLNRGFGEADLNRLTAPVGLPIASDTPEEIAVSVAAQILQLTKQLGFQ